MNIAQLKRFLPLLIATRTAAMVQGPHGIGKSQAIKQFALENGYEYVDRRLSQMESGDLLGLPDLSNGRTTFCTPEWLPTDPEAKVIIFLDELNRARPDVLQGIFQLVLDRELGSYKLPENCYVLTAVNPNTDDYHVTNIFDKALQDRFCHIKLTPTMEEFLSYSKQDASLDQNVISFLQAREEVVEDSKLVGFSIERTPSRRSWTTAARLVKLGIPSDLFIEGVGGLVGMPNAVAFQTWLQENETKAFSASEIMNDFKKIKKKAAEYADSKNGRHDILTQSLDNVSMEIQTNYKNVSQKQVDNVIDFLKLLPGDLSFGWLKTNVLKTDVDEFSEFFTSKFIETDATDTMIMPPEEIAELEEIMAKEKAAEAKAKKD